MDKHFNVAEYLVTCQQMTVCKLDTLSVPAILTKFHASCFKI